MILRRFIATLPRVARIVPINFVKLASKRWQDLTVHEIEQIANLREVPNNEQSRKALMVIYKALCERLLNHCATTEPSEDGRDLLKQFSLACSNLYVSPSYPLYRLPELVDLVYLSYGKIQHRYKSFDNATRATVGAICMLVRLL